MLVEVMELGQIRELKPLFAQTLVAPPACNSTSHGTASLPSCTVTLRSNSSFLQPFWDAVSSTGAMLCTRVASTVVLSEGLMRTDVVLRIKFIFIQIGRAFRLELPVSAAWQQ